MSDFANVDILGRVTADPQGSVSSNGTTIARFSMAVNRRHTSNTGQTVENTSFFDTVAFGRQADVILNHVAKGHLLLIEGRLEQRRWVDRDGNNQSRLQVVVHRVHLMPRIHPDAPQDAPQTTDDLPPTQEEQDAHDQALDEVNAQATA